MAQSAAKRKTKTFHATIRATRIEEWFVEAETAEQARKLLEGGAGHRSQSGECIDLEIDKLSD